MTRLKKKANGNKIELFHATSSQVLKKIKESGSLQPSGETGVSSNGLADNQYKDEKAPSGNQEGIYLGDDSVLGYYHDGAVNGTFFDKDAPNIPVDLKLSVNTDNLVPDYDDLVVVLSDPEDNDELESIFEPDVPRWMTSLDEISQVIHVGTIDSNEITSVRFISNGVLFSSYGENLDILKESIQFDTWITFENAITQLEEIENKIKNLEPQVASSRLKRIKRG